jgi:hypothetical protein
MRACVIVPPTPPQVDGAEIRVPHVSDLRRGDFARKTRSTPKFPRNRVSLQFLSIGKNW